MLDPGGLVDGTDDVEQQTQLNSGTKLESLPSHQLRPHIYCHNVEIMMFGSYQRSSIIKKTNNIPICFSIFSVELKTRAIFWRSAEEQLSTSENNFVSDSAEEHICSCQGLPRAK
jgi:hypothetical protein